MLFNTYVKLSLEYGMINKKLYVITGAPGSGKTSILKCLSEKQGINIFQEPARSIISEQRSIDGQGIYDQDPYLFKELMLSRSVSQYLEAHEQQNITFFDRGIPDIIAYTDCFNLPAGAEEKASDYYRYNPIVFYAPPWDAIFTNDEDRKLNFEQSCEFGEMLKIAYRHHGYNLNELPFTSPDERAKYIIEMMGITQ